MHYKVINSILIITLIAATKGKETASVATASTFPYFRSKKLEYKNTMQENKNRPDNKM